MWMVVTTTHIRVINNVLPSGSPAEDVAYTVYATLSRARTARSEQNEYGFVEADNGVDGVRACA